MAILSHAITAIMAFLPSLAPTHRMQAKKTAKKPANKKPDTKKAAKKPAAKKPAAKKAARKPAAKKAAKK